MLSADKRVAVAMSGGVDSAVAAALLLAQGWQVQGLTMRLWREDGVDPAPAEAAIVCQQLGIAHQVIDLREAFVRQVVEPFVHDYTAGRTPNPCLRCNHTLKFGVLLESALALGAHYLATGHYARTRHVDGAWQLLCAADARKDQSYVLYALGQTQLAYVLFPLGDLTKEQVRADAARLGLTAVERAESQDICFLRDNDYRRYLAQRAPEAVRPGPILDAQGRTLGQHKGLPFYTVGQREGLGLAAPRPLYVMRLDAQRNALVVGYDEELGRRELTAAEVSWVSGGAPAQGAPVEAKVRYRARRTAAYVWPLPGARIRVTLAEPLRDITPGQGVVLYQGEVVLGGGIIEE